MTDRSTDGKHLPILIDFNKSIIGIVSLLLGFSVTFISSNVTNSLIVVSFITWSLLIICAVCALLSVALIVNVMKSDTSENVAIFLSNAAFFVLLLSLASFVVLGIGKMGEEVQLKKSNQGPVINCQSLTTKQSLIEGRDCRITLPL